MITTLVSSLLLAVFLANLVAMVYFHVKSKKENPADKIFKMWEKTITLMTDSVSKMDSMHKILAAYPKVEVAKNGYSRVYGLLLGRGLETRLFVAPAQTFEEATRAALLSNGPDFAVLSSAYAEVPKQVERVEVPKRFEMSEMKHLLLMAGDKFAENNFQKGAIRAVASNVEKLWPNKQ